MDFHLFEFEDLPWFPNLIRESMTDYLRYILNTVNFYDPITPIIKEGLDKTKQLQIFDICSGGGGSIEKVQANIKRRYDVDIQITLSDKFPNITSYRYLKEKSKGQIDFVEYPVDAMNVPSTAKGLRVMFSGFHHFNPEQAKLVIENAVIAKQGIAVFDGGDKNIFTILAIILFHPIIFFLFTPFFKPFRLSRLLFTYILPIIPLFTIWDGIVSIIRLYKTEDLLKMASEIDNENYTWKAGKLKNKAGMNVAYLLGYPNTGS